MLNHFFLFFRFISNTTPSSYKPTSFDKFLTSREVGGEPCNLTVWDTSGSQNFDTVRPLSYGEADVFILCFKVTSIILTCKRRSIVFMVAGR